MLDGTPPPAGGDPALHLIFEPRGFASDAQNDLGSPFLLHELTLRNDYGVAFGLDGGLLRFSGANPTIHLDGYRNVVIENALELAATNGVLHFIGNGFGEAGLTGIIRDFGGPQAIRIATNAPTITNQLLTFAGLNTYTGGTRIESGNVAIFGTNALGTGAVTIAGGTLRFSSEFFPGDHILTNSLLLESNLVIAGNESGRFQGAISSAISNTGIVVRANEGRFNVEAPATYNGATVIDPGLPYASTTGGQPVLSISGNGSILATSRIVVSAGGALEAYQLPGAVSNFISDTAPIELRSGELLVRNDSFTDVMTETVGSIFGSGFSLLSVSGSRQAALVGEALLRVGRGTFDFRGTALGRPFTQTPHSRFGLRPRLLGS
jgi:autotransporter-associated beta strand protein